MKNKIEDVRNHLVACMEALNQDDLTPEQSGAVIEKAKAMSSLATSFTNAVKVELDAVRLADEVGMLPASFGQPQVLDAPRPALSGKGGRP
jgi:hypothetical protein